MDKGNKKIDFFISYNSNKDEQWAKWIAGTLEENEYRCLIQAWDFNAGNNFVLKMNEGLTKPDRVIGVLSQDYMDSPNCQQEWAAAFNRDPTGEKGYFIPVLVTDFKPTGLFASHIYIKLFGVDNEAEAEKRLIEGVSKKGKSRPKPPFPAAFGSSNSGAGSAGSDKVRFPGRFPLHNIPYNRNSYFTERGNMIEVIKNRFESGSTSVSLTQSIRGMGGLGKTQTALEYAYRYWYAYDYIWWVNAENNATVSNSYRDIALKLKLIDSDFFESDRIVEAVTNWMSGSENWLIIYDNAEDVKGDTVWWPKQLRKEANQNVIVTTRNKNFQFGTEIGISVFTVEEAVDFLKKRTAIRKGLEKDEKAARKLAERLGCLPLALEYAAAYICENDNTTYSSYLALLEEFGLELLDKTDEALYYKMKIRATMELSIAKIGIPAAKDLLYLCSFFAPDNIDPVFITENADIFPSPLKEELAHKLKNNKLWAELNRYSVLNVHEDGKGYSIHRLMQEIVKDGMGDKEKKRWALCCLALFENNFDFEYGNAESHQNFIKLSPHVKAFLQAAESILTDDEHQELFAYLYNKAGLGNHNLGRYADALEMQVKALTISEKVLGLEHPNTATTYNNMAGMYNILGDYPKALELQGKALAIFEKVLGLEHPHTATTYNNMAGMYDTLGDYPKALELYGKALPILEKVLGLEHPHTATIYNNIAEVYSTLGDYPKALELHEKALAIRKGLGLDHPSTATTYNNMAVVYKALKDYPKAFELFGKALAIREKVLGLEHPNTATTYNNMALVYDTLEDYPKALELYEKALAICEKVLGTEHPHTKTVRENMAYIKEKLSTSQ